MKKILLILLITTNWCFAQQQTITYTISPPTFTENETITVTFDGTSIDEAAWGVTDNALYLWAWSYDLSFGNGIDCPTNGSWTSSNEANKLTYNSGSDTYSISFVPSTFYARTGIGRIGFLVKAKNGDGDKKSQDILTDLEINQLTLTSPTENPVIVDSGTQINISASTIFTSDFSLKANGIEVNSATGTTSYSYNFTVTEDTEFILEANDGNQVLSKTFSARLPSQFPVPSGMLDGINLDPNDNTKATLVLYAPGKQTVHVIGDFNNWQEDANYLMNHDTARDRFWIELTGLTPQFNHMYQYLVDSTIKVADPYSTVILDPTEDQYLDSTTYPNLPAYPSGLTTYDVTLLRTGDPDYNWQTTNFTRPEKTDLVIYELLVRDFDELHSFDAVKARLDYIESLGVNAIELMPVNEFDGNLSWGYNPAFHMALDKYYGTTNAFKQLIDECHSRGIAVIMDVVYNHASGQNPYYRLWNTDNGGYNGQASVDSPFFNQTATHAYSVYNDFNHSKQATRDYVKRTTQYWISEFKIDGFRWDLTKGFTQNCSSSDGGCTDSYQQDRVDVLKLYADYQWDVDPNFYVIFEHLGGITEEKQWADYRANEGKGIMLWNRLDPPYSEATIGNHVNGASNFSNVSYAAKGFDGPSAVSYMESHDEQRVMYRNLTEGKSSGDYNVKDLNTALERMETAGAFFFTVPGPKMIWQFGELGYEVDINFNGRTGNKPIRWEYLDDPNRMAIYNTWSKLIDLKHKVPAFKTTDFTIDASSTTGLKTIHLNLPSATGNEIKYVTIIGNFGLTTQNINPVFQETGTWYNLLNKNTPYDVSSTSSVIELAPGEFKVYGNNPYINPDDLDSDGVLNVNDTCSNTPLGATVDVNGCEVFTLPTTNFSLQVTGETCRSSNNGSISIAAAQNLNYTATIIGNGINQTNTFTTNYTADNLEAGDYDVCITVDGQSNYKQCFNVSISQPEDIAVLSKVSNTKNSVSLDMSGSTLYKVTLNGVTTETSQSNIELQLSKGTNTISVEGDKICQGLYKETIFYGEDVKLFPNPITDNILNIYLGDFNSELSTITVYSMLGNQIYTEKTTENNVKIDASSFSKGMYILNVTTNNDVRSFKIIKN
ncbi:alpha-amylase family glycosyl hydrolase [Yeosuana marina]|uniref:alpha-amylase family glycosyl hydrolase n=1 Tax=Yeosuana marina TaxID=1565536 RepID=UPI0030EB5553|tara:strand:- start:1958 stop:5299 length:3342 start_codon:yes stop_codon:yes gene_type:complete